mmetsp:Transcript_1919/g.6863  ORF Transcript_1919/g.6863 Transcript_1919/m.6863 type:complete len:341 (+) Transcript_1919:2-1024(+)
MTRGSAWALVACLACCLVGLAAGGQVLAGGTETGDLPPQGISISFESPYNVADVFLVLDAGISETNATFVTEVMVAFEDTNVWVVPYVISPTSGIQNWTLSTCDLDLPFMAGTWTLELAPTRAPQGGYTYSIGYVFGAGNETLDSLGQEANMYTEKAVYEYSFEDSYTDEAELTFNFWGDEFTTDYMTGIYIGKNSCPSPTSALVSYTDFDNWDGQPIEVSITDATHGTYFVLLAADDINLTTEGPWPEYSVSMSFRDVVVEPVGSSGNYESISGDSPGAEDDGDGDGDGNGLQTWEVVLIIGIALITLLVCGALGLFAYMKYKAWQFDKEWDDPVYDTY